MMSDNHGSIRSQIWSKFWQSIIDISDSNIQELKKYTNPLNEDIARLERELKLITSEIKEKDVLEKELNKTIKTVDDILNNQTITYQIYHKFVTNPNDVTILQTEDKSVREVTLITCTNDNKQRHIIKARAM